MCHFIENRIFWYKPKIVNKNVKEELKSWRNNISIYNGYTFNPWPLRSCLLSMDATDESCSEFVLKHIYIYIYIYNIIYW